MILDKISNRLQISLINSRKLSVNPQLLHLDTIVKQAFFINRFEAQKNGQSLILSIRKSPTIYADSLAVYDIIDHILKNAIKFSSEGKTTEIILDEHDGKASIEIIDQGCGLSQDEVDRISGWLQMQNTQAISKITPGIGFPVIKELLELQKGWIRVYSKGKGCGSKFSIGFETASLVIRNSIHEVA
ncbi:MAG: HAMP domain-containing sensor histidine kinase [Bacteroidia bacterium]